MPEHAYLILLIIALVFLVAVGIFWFTNWRKPHRS